MCGIAGKFVFGNGATVSEELVKRMCNTIAHRGPDDEGYYIDGPIALGHRRLSIIDLESGHQPISNEDQTVWVVFNGEIYNYRELREGLISRGHHFRTASDTEVMVHLYEEQGEDFVASLRGMFAIALWDERNERLILARDRVGKKPLHYAELPGRGIVFGSEIKAILQDPEIKRELNAEALDSYLTLLYVPTPFTMIQGIHKLPAGHLLVCTRDQVRIKEYWDLIYETDAPLRSEESYQTELCDLLRESVKIRLRSDVPLGAFLSGGIDSSSVVAFMVEQLDQPVVTCSVGFNEITHNELPYARSVARHLQCNHHEYLIEPALADEILKIVEFFDEPFGDSSAIPTYYVSQMARRHVTVALSGDGGDETFAGYSRHYLHMLERRIQRVLGWRGVRVASKVGASLPVKGQPMLQRLGMPPDVAYAWKQSHFLFNEQQRAQLYSGSLRDNCSGLDPSARFRSYYNRCTAMDPLNKALYVDLKTYLVDDILVKVDRMSMAHGLEVRCPLLDHKLLEFAATLPTGLKLKGQMTKVVLRRVMKERVPPEVLTRRKQGFTMPVAEWLRKPLRTVVEDCLFAPRSLHRGLFNGAFLRRLWSDHLNERQDYSQHLWLLLMFELWHRKYLDHHS